MLIDNHGRKINYLRLAITDRCNLRCNYCMPAEGIDFAPREEVLTIQELCRLCDQLIALGIDKIRLTGGEPFVRKDIMFLIRSLAQNTGLRELSVTSNATLIGKHIDELIELGIDSVNISLDAFTEDTFRRITRRDQFTLVHDNILRLMDAGIRVRINFVVLKDQNTHEILPMLDWQKNYPVDVRFLEEMPFNGGSRTFEKLQWNYKQILEHIVAVYPEAKRMESPAEATAIQYKIPGHKGTFGLIPSFSRTFCGSCNRLRITATGDVITCLYGRPKMNLRDLIRNTDDKGVQEAILQAIGSRAKTGFDAQQENQNVFDTSMTSIGG